MSSCQRTTKKTLLRIYYSALGRSCVSTHMIHDSYFLSLSRSIVEVRCERFLLIIFKDRNVTYRHVIPVRTSNYLYTYTTYFKILLRKIRDGENSYSMLQRAQQKRLLSWIYYRVWSVWKTWLGEWRGPTWSHEEPSGASKLPRILIYDLITACLRILYDDVILACARRMLIEAHAIRSLAIRSCGSCAMKRLEKLLY